MIAYVDASVLLRVVLRQSNALKEWISIERGVASALVEVECLRTLDRLRLRDGLPDSRIAVRREAVFRLMEAMEIVDLNRPVLERAATVPNVAWYAGCDPLGDRSALARALGLRIRDGYPR